MQVVVAVTLSVLTWSLILLTFCYPLMRRVVLAAARRILQTPARLVAFVAVMFTVPVVLIAI